MQNDNIFNQIPKMAQNLLDKTEHVRRDVENAMQSLKNLGTELAQDIEQNVQENVMPIFSYLKEDLAQSSEQHKVGVFQSHTGAMEYELFIPKVPIIQSEQDKIDYASYLRPTALLVFLHGCEQTAADFALGTQMNAWAQKYNYHVLYPQQSKLVNPKGCWNWFLKTEQTKNMGQSHMIANLTYKIMSQYGLSGATVFVGGLSAGASMAHILALNYPELYTAAALVAGVPMGLSSDAKQALQIMKYGPTKEQVATAFEQRYRSQFTSITPLIVFQGMKDTVVHAKNAEAFVEYTLSEYAAKNPNNPKPQVSVRQTLSLDKGNAQRQVYRNSKDQVFLESWRLEEVAHAWPGGFSEGSYTTNQGVDASQKIMEFFENFRR